MTTTRDTQWLPTVVDLFCGPGGLALGFKLAGFECVLSIDNHEAPVQTCKANLGHDVVWAEITEDTQFPDADVVIGGPPCQGFSSAGMRRDGDRRNTLVRVFADLVARHKPRAFVFENVEGFLTGERANRVLDLLDPLVAAGYRIHLRKVNAANYGVPQHRKRVIAIGGLGWDPSFPEPTHMAFGAPGATQIARHLPRASTVLDAIAGLPAPAGEPPGQPSDHWVRPVSPAEAARMKLLKPGQTMKDLPEHLWHDSYRRRAYRRVMDGTPTERRGGAPAGLRRLAADQPSKAITSGAISEFVHPIEDRYLTLRECARIQSFPDDFSFVGTTSEKILQIGNAVPPRLARAVAQTLRNDLERAEACEAEGAVLSFEPAYSNGMSPALATTVNLVRERFFRSQPKQVQLELWH
jgi:DNA (cytosine-5)-methyltransferase 1